jgi:adenylate cyclase
MSDIFISYSPQDAEQALTLTEKLRTEGIDVWIDRRDGDRGIQSGAEIVEHIDACSTFVLLISIDSVESDEVLKELSIAFDQNKRIIPVELDPIVLPSSFAAVAELQRVAITDFDAILRAHKYGPARIVQSDTRTSLIVLPFGDLSPTEENNAWFADGMTAEMIDALAKIKSLRVLDRSSAMTLRGAKLSKAEIGKEFNTRYFIEGTIRKVGNEIDIVVSLLDIESGEQLWQETHHGEFKNIFGIQEAVAEKVIVALKLHLTKIEREHLRDRGTENTHAYELMMKALVYFHRQTREGFVFARQLFSGAIQIDPEYAQALRGKAHALASIYRDYDRDPALLEEALQLLQEALRLKPTLWSAYHPLSIIYNLQGKLGEAERAAQDYVSNAPEDPLSYFALGFFYAELGQYEKAIAPYEQRLKLRPDDWITLWNLVITCREAGELDKQRYWARVAVPRYEKYIRLLPDNEDMRIGHALLLYYAGKEAEARQAAPLLDNVRDGMSLYRTACLHCFLKEYELGLGTIHKAIDAGFRNVEMLSEFLNDEEGGIGSLKGTPEYEEIKKMVQGLSEL